MSYAVKWSTMDANKRIVSQQLKNYGHLLKWKNYKETCLDVGCAEGTVTKQVLYPYIQNYTEKLVAIDKLDGMIHFAKVHNSHEKIEYQTVDILNDRMVTTLHNKFGHLFSFFVSHLIPDTRSYLTTLHKMLKSDGQIFVIVLVDNFFKRILSQLYKAEPWLKYKLEDPTDYTANPVEHITDLLRNIGFKVDLCEYEKGLITTENLKGFVTAVADMYQNLRVIPSELFEVFSEELLQKSREICINLGEPEKYNMPTEILVFIATKLS